MRTLALDFISRSFQVGPLDPWLNPEFAVALSPGARDDFFKGVGKSEYNVTFGNESKNE
jgi:hypothetical protein